MQIFTVAPVAHYTMHNAVAHYIPYSAKKKKSYMMMVVQDQFNKRTKILMIKFTWSCLFLNLIFEVNYFLTFKKVDLMFFFIFLIRRLSALETLNWLVLSFKPLF